MGVKAALSSNLLTRAPECSTSSAMAYSVAGLWPSLDVRGRCGNVLNVTRKNFAVTGGKEIVCSVVPSLGIRATTW